MFCEETVLREWIVFIDSSVSNSTEWCHFRLGHADERVLKY